MLGVTEKMFEKSLSGLSGPGVNNTRHLECKVIYLRTESLGAYMKLMYDLEVHDLRC